MHYVLIASVITLYIYFRFGKKPLGYILILIALLAIMRGLLAFAIPAGLIAYLLLRNEKLTFPSINGRKGKSQNKGTNHQSHDGQTRTNGPGPGNGQPAIIAPAIAIFLDADTGEISGVIREGELRDKPLSQLTEDQFITLIGEFHQRDKESTQILTAYLDAEVKGWREKFELPEKYEDSPLGQSSSLMPREALINLGLTYAADESDIKKAHRRLMKKFHPDQGGSPYLAARINMAKDVLLKNSPNNRKRR